MNIIHKTLAAAAVAAATALTASAQEFPTKTITIIVPFSAGGSSDIGARLAAEKLSASIGQPVVVENKTGANGQVAVNEFMSKEADGYTLLWVSHGIVAINPALYKDLSYDPLKDFEPITLAFTSTHILLVPTDSPFKAPADIVAAAKEQPGELTFASVGVGSGSHLVAEMFKTEAGISTEHVPYKGSTDALPDVISGRVSYFFDGPANSLGMIKEGKLRALAVTDTQRAAYLPDVPTMAEAGFRNSQLNAWFGLVAKSGTPEPIITRLHAELVKAYSDPTIVAKMADIGTSVRPSASPAEFADMFKSEHKRLGAAVVAANAVQ
ncbi:Bug family tripartite tricarboxylate transporter substrate binding protein [Ensifer canadensis]